LVAKLSIYLFSCKESNSNISDYEIGLAQIAAASILKINCIFYLQKRATTGAPFFVVEKNNLLKNLVADSWIGFKKL
jgi:hypothetical protein